MPTKSETSCGPPPLQPVSLASWVASTRRLLSMEQEEEVALMQHELALLDDRINPNVLTHLTLAHASTGLFGRTVLHLSFPSLHVRHAKSHHFTVGDLVQLRVETSKAKRKPFPTGLVARVEERGITIAITSDHDDVEEMDLFTATMTLDRLVNNATYQKLTQTLDRLTQGDFGPAQAVHDVVFSNRAPSWHMPVPVITPLNAGLNPSQVEAIQFALASKDLALIHGPPGTGKTTTVVELILQAIERYACKVLVCAPSNIAVDNVLEKLATTCSKLKKKLNLVRLGHPARVMPQILRYCLDAKIEMAEGTELVQDIRKEVSGMEKQWQKTREKSVRSQLRREMKANRKEMRVREQKVVRDIVHQSNVVFATNVGAASKLLKDVTFDLVIIDEAAQALEASCWIPILKAKRCVLAGDHLQLPPTIKSKTAAAKGLEVTLFDRMTRYTSTQGVVKLLDTQYRMHKDISDWSSRAMYEGKLKTFEAVARRKLHELPHVAIEEEDLVLNATLLLVDTAGCELEEDESEEIASGLHLSKSNEGEARIVAKHVHALLAAGLKEDEVAVITPYNKQVQTLKALLLPSYPNLAIRSVDGFQGCEKEAVVMSLVRSNASRQVGFLADDRRMNVAITRAKRHVALICDTDTIASHKFLAKLVHHFEEVGEIQSAQEYLDDDMVHGSVDNVLMTIACPSKPHVESQPEAKAKAQKPGNVRKEPKTCLSIVHDESKDTSKGVITVEPEVHDEVETVVQSEVQDEVKTVVKPSVFQLMQSASESSTDSEQEDSNSVSSVCEVEPQISLLKELHMSRVARVGPRSTVQKKSKKKKRQGKTGTDVHDGADELAFLTRQATTSSKCACEHPRRCRTSIAMLGHVCQFCHLKFCLDHAIPEVHGCGDAVRTFARRAFQTNKLPRSNMTMDQRKKLEKKLHEKVAAKAGARQLKATPK